MSQPELFEVHYVNDSIRTCGFINERYYRNISQGI